MFSGQLLESVRFYLRMRVSDTVVLVTGCQLAESSSRRERRRPRGTAQKVTAEEKDLAEITKRTQFDR